MKLPAFQKGIETLRGGTENRSAKHLEKKERNTRELIFAYRGEKKTRVCNNSARNFQKTKKRSKLIRSLRGSIRPIRKEKEKRILPSRRAGGERVQRAA